MRQGVTNVQVQEVISKHLEKAGLNFGEVATKAMFDKLDSLATSSRQEGGDLIFSAPKLIAILEEEGDIHKLLGETIERARDKLEEMVDSLNKFKGSVLEVTRIQEQMAKHRLASELAILDKQQSIRNRVNQALQRSPDAVDQAMNDLRDRMALLVTGGVEGKRFGKPIERQSLFDLDQLFGKLRSLEEERAKRRELIEPTADTTAGKSDEEIAALTTAYQDNSNTVGDLSREIVGVKGAISALAK